MAVGVGSSRTWKVRHLRQSAIHNSWLYLPRSSLRRSIASTHQRRRRGSKIKTIRDSLERLEKEARWIPKGTEKHAESRGQRAQLNVDFADAIEESKRDDKDKAKRQALRTARFFYKSAIKMGNARRKLEWYRGLLDVSERLHGGRFEPGRLDDACDEDMLVDRGGAASETQISFARSSLCAELLDKASQSAEAGGDLERAEKLMSQALGVYPPEGRGLSDEDKKRRDDDIRGIRDDLDRLKSLLEKAR